MSGIPAGAGSLLGKRLGKYEILALLALGGTAEIYLARIGGASGFEKYVVVKCLHDHLADDIEFVRMFLDEARLAAQLDHSNIVQTMELGEHEDRYYMVMEFLAGLSLAMIVRRAAERLPGGRLPVPLVLNMIAQSCAGLHYAHERTQNGKPLNIVHRDISPQNLVVSFEGVVKVVDFGIAKAEYRETRTRSGTIKGKFAYMSPEQCVANNVDRRTDVFALGVIAHELLTGRRLFKRTSPYETYQAVIECAVDPPSSQNVELDPAVDPIVMRALAREKEDRYPTAEAFGDALLGYLHHRGKGAGPNDVGRFFETTFAQEIDEHHGRMRELISGRESFSVDTGVKWGEGDEKPQETVDLSGDRGYADDTGDVLAVERPSVGSLTSAIDDLDGPPAGDEDDIPAERTRIEANPLERIEQLNEVVKQQKTPSPELRPQAHTMPPSGPLPLPPPPSMAVPAGSHKFSGELANLPTQIGADQVVPELASTELGAVPIDPNSRTSLEMEPPGHGHNGVPLGQQTPHDDSQSAHQGMAPLQPSQHPHPSSGMHPLQHPMTSQQMTAQPPVLTSYPVMNKQMSQQVMSGATVYPSDGFEAISPVGQHYPDGTDWAAAAAAPVRVIPTWLLAVLFVGALGIALGLTIAIAKIAS